MISGKTTLIAHLGYPTEAFKAPLIYNPWFEQSGVDAVVVPMGVRAEDYPVVLKSLFRLTNIRGALVTMPHKIATVALMDEITPTVRVAGSCNAILLRRDGTLLGDMFDGEGFVRGALRKGCVMRGARALVVGAGGVGCAIVASLAAAGVAALGLYDERPESAEALAGRIHQNFPAIEVRVGSKDPDGYGIVVNATPMGMNAADPLPIDVGRIAPSAFVGEVVMKTDLTPFLLAARAKGCRIQIGKDMLFEQIPAYLEFFGFPTATADELRVVAAL